MNIKVKVLDIIADPNQPRKYFSVEKLKQLKKSVEKHGIINPLIVEKQGSQYLLVDGERRFRVAQELKLKEIEVVVLESKDPVARLIEQFHIQEQHEGWNPLEKAQVLISLKNETKKSLPELCELLSINDRTARNYMAFDALQNKKEFIESEIPVWHALRIKFLKAYVQKIKNEFLEETFDAADQRKLEKVIVKKVQEEEMNKDRDYTKLKDSFRINPKMIDLFLEGNSTAEELYVKSKARAAYHLRNATNNAGYIGEHIRALLSDKKGLALNKNEINIFEEAKKSLKELLDTAGAFD